MQQIDDWEASGMAPPSRRPRLAGGGGGVLPLPLDASYEILLRLAAKDLCRLRAVSRQWRALLSDPQFIAAHAARHPGPLVVAGYGLGSGYPEGDILCEIMDLSGRVLKRIRAIRAGDMIWDSVVSTRADFVEIVKGLSCGRRLLDPATGAVSVLPEELADEHAALQLDIFEYRCGILFSKVASTGEYKAVRVFDNTFDEPYSDQLCEVFTIDGSHDARWRAKKAPPYPVNVRLGNMEVVKGIAFFFFNDGSWFGDVMPKLIASFDLGTEEWGKTLQGPLFRFDGSAPGIPPSGHMDFNRVRMASLNDCLAVVHCMRSAYIDIWLLMDFEKGLWVRQHSIQIKKNAPDDGFRVHPLLVLNDGRIVIYSWTRGLLRIYNPRTTDYTDLAVTRSFVTMDLYTGNLLSLPNGARQ